MLGFLRKRGSANSCEPGNHSTTVTYTRNKATLTVNFTGPNDGTFVAPSTITQQITIGESYSVSVPIVQNYSASQNTVSGTMVDEGVTVNISYTRITATLTITYVGPNDGNFVTPSVYSTTVNAGDNYSVNSPAVSTYTPDIATVSGTMPTTDVSVTVTYTRDKATLTITYSGPDDGTFVAPATYSAQVTIGDSYSVSSPSVSGYTPSVATVSGNMAANGYSTTVTYSKVVTIHITYIGPNNQFFNTPSEYTRTIASGAAYSVTSPSRTGFTPDQATVSGTAGNDDIEVTVTYSRNADLEIYGFQFIGDTESDPASKIVYCDDADNANWSPVNYQNFTGTTDSDGNYIQSLGCEWDNAFFVKDTKLYAVNRSGVPQYEMEQYPGRSGGNIYRLGTSTAFSNSGNKNLGICTRIPRVYVYYAKDASGGKYYFSNYKLNTSFNAFAHKYTSSGAENKYLYITRTWFSSDTDYSFSGSMYSVTKYYATGSSNSHVNVSGSDLTPKNAQLNGTDEKWTNMSNSGMDTTKWKIFNVDTWRLLNLLGYLMGKSSDILRSFGVEMHRSGTDWGNVASTLKFGSKNYFGMACYWGSSDDNSNPNWNTTIIHGLYTFQYCLNNNMGCYPFLRNTNSYDYITNYSSSENIVNNPLSGGYAGTEYKGGAGIIPIQSSSINASSNTYWCTSWSIYLTNAFGDIRYIYEVTFNTTSTSISNNNISLRTSNFNSNSRFRNYYRLIMLSNS